MRAAAIAFVIALALAPSLAFAQAAGPPPGDQGAPPPGGPPPGEQGMPPPGGGVAVPPGAISRDQFIQQRAEAAGRLFDQIDTNHMGYITRAQLRAYSRARRAGGPGGPPPQQ
jgi:hypothetical protein